MEVSELAGRMNNKIGPLPAWAWAAIPAGAYVAWSYYKANTSDEVIVDTGTGTETSDLVDQYGINAGGSSLPSYSAAPSGSSNLPNVDAPEYTNETWFRQASNYLIGEGVNPTDVVTALNSYIYGVPDTVNTTQMDALRRAIVKFGAAPDGGHVPKLAGSPSTPPSTSITLPDAPTSVKISSAPAGTYANVTVSWGRPQRDGGSPIIGYKVALQYNKAGQWIGMQSTTVLGAVRSYRFDRLTKGRTYRVAVAARNARGHGPTATATMAVPK